MKRDLNNIISIVTPSLNQGRFLEQTIQSVISQAGDFYIDYIIADGGSTDDSAEIIKKYDALIKNGKFVCQCRGVELRWWSQKDNGQSAALNNAFCKAKGDILAWINSDDYYDDTCVFQTIRDNFLAHGGVDLICGSGRVINEHGREKLICKTVEVNEDLLLKRGCNVFQPSAFFSRKIYFDVGGINEDLYYAMDFDLWIRISQKSKSLSIDKVLSNFREWGNAKSVTSTKDFIREEKYIAKKYGGNIISFKTIRKLRRKIIIFDWLQKNLPSSYEKGKKCFYGVVDLFHYY
ncbi:MAG: glycosyltransferase family 2 protein [Smithella sp.]|jgi:glycosyltransferase involved in cell wall biosynthesis